jgi:hypothetical protein
MDLEQAINAHFLVDHSKVLISNYSSRTSVEKLQNKDDEAETPRLYFATTGRGQLVLQWLHGHLGEVSSGLTVMTLA